MAGTELNVASIVDYARAQGLDVLLAEIPLSPHFVKLFGTDFQAFQYSPALDVATAAQLAMQHIYWLVTTHPDAKGRRCFVRAVHTVEANGRSSTLGVFVYIRKYVREDGFVILY